MLLFIAVLLPLTTLQSSSGAAIHKLHSTRHKRRADLDLSGLKDRLQALSESYAPYQVKRGCQFGLNSHHCKLSMLDAIMGQRSFLHSGYSPGKRSSPSNTEPPSEIVKRSCAVGLNSHHCKLAMLDALMGQRSFLHSGFSPGKRSSPSNDISSDLAALSNALEASGVDDGTDTAVLLELPEEPAPRRIKRTCEFRLGNHCLTEAMDRAASQYFWLKSPLSPGRRKRHVARSPDAAPPAATRR